ncbi:GntR family transcriptional regulator [Streptomyces sp. NPDC002402]
MRGDLDPAGARRPQNLGGSGIGVLQGLGPQLAHHAHAVRRVLCITWPGPPSTRRTTGRGAHRRWTGQARRGAGRRAEPAVRVLFVLHPPRGTDRLHTWPEAPGDRAAPPPEPEIGAALQVDPDDLAVQLIRLRLLDGRPAMLERMTYVEAVGRPLISADLDSGSIYALLTEQGIDLHSARHTFDAIPADPLDAKLLEVPEGTPLLRERRLTTDSQGTPIEWSDDRYRSDVATVTVTNTRSSRTAML